jgi:hypothetical protein
MIIAGTLMGLLVPVLILITARFIGPMKRNPKVVYSICAVLAVLVCTLPPAATGQWGPAVISAVLALLFLWWGYRRDSRSLAPPTPPPQPPRKGTDY